jgi:hypothetical protein
MLDSAVDSVMFVEATDGRFLRSEGEESSTDSRVDSLVGFRPRGFPAFGAFDDKVILFASSTCNAGDRALRGDLGGGAMGGGTPLARSLPSMVVPRLSLSRPFLSMMPLLGPTMGESGDGDPRFWMGKLNEADGRTKLRLGVEAAACDRLWVERYVAPVSFGSDLGSKDFFP